MFRQPQKNDVIEKLALLNQEYNKSMNEKNDDAAQDRLAQFKLLLDELEKFKKINLEADDKELPIPKLPKDASQNERELKQAIKQAASQEKDARWLTLYNCCSVAEEIFMKKNSKNETVFLKDIELLKSTAQFSQAIVKDPSQYNDDKFNKIKNEINNRIENHTKYYDKGMVMPKVWGGLLIALGVLIMAAGVAVEIAGLLLSGGTMAVPAILAALGIMCAGAGVIAAGITYMSFKSNKLDTRKPIATSKLTDTVHGLHSKQKTRIEKTEELNEKLKPKKE